MGIKIGNNNIIKNSNITERTSIEEKKKWTEQHPILISVIISFSVGFILLFSFWRDIISWLEGMF